MDHALELQLPDEFWRSFAEHRAVVQCSSGHLIYIQDTTATCFYYLKRGRVKSYIQSPQGDERVLRLYQAGEIFGEAAFFDELPRVSSAMALTRCELVPIDQELVQAQFQENPVLAMSMIRYLSRTVRLLSNQVDDMAFYPAQQRLARYLLNILPPNGKLSVTQEELSNAVSVSRMTVSRILSSWKREGVLDTNYKTLYVSDLQALTRYSNKKTDS